MAGIPSIGDILMLSQLAWKIGRAFTAGRKGAPAEFLEVETAVNSLAKALKLLAEALFAEADDSVLNKADQETQEGVATILTSCQRTVQDLDSLLDQYQVIKKHRTAGGFAIDRSWSDLVIAQYKTMLWTTEGGRIQDLRNMLQMHTSTITLTMQALQSKSLSRLESIVTPMAEKIDNIHHRTGSLSEQLEEVHRIVVHIAGRTPQLQPVEMAESRPPSSIRLDASLHATPIVESFSARDYFPQRQNSRSRAPKSPPLPQPPSPTTTSPSTRTRTSEISFSSASTRYSDSYASSDTDTIGSWSSPPTIRTSATNQQSQRRDSKLPMTPEVREPKSRPDSGLLPSLPPPAMDLAHHDGNQPALSMSNLSLNNRTLSDIKSLHRSSTTISQKDLFEKQAFRNSAILCDVRGTLVEYTQKVSPNEDSHDVEMVEACASCRITIVRQREATAEGKDTRLMTSIWVFSDDNTVRLQLKLDDEAMYLPYSSYFNPEKISVTVPCELKYHDVIFARRLLKLAKTSWINYVFDDVKGATQFQNELMGRTLLGTYQTTKTMRVHEGFSGAFSYAEQMCGMENLRVWEDDDTGAVIALIHFSAHFRKGYLAFYLNSSRNPVRFKDEGGREVKIKGLRVPLEGKEGKRKDSGATVREGDRESKEERKKWITGAKVEFASESEKAEFLGLVKEVQRCLVELPELLGVN